MFNSLRWKVLREWWSNLLGQEAALGLSLPRTPTRLESPLPAIREPYACPSSLSKLGELGEPYLNLWWCSFRSPTGDFMGVVIARGKSPASAAKSAIDKGIVESERARIVMIPVNREGEFEEYEDRLLDREVAARLLRQLDIQAVES